MDLFDRIATWQDVAVGKNLLLHSTCVWLVAPDEQDIFGLHDLEREDVDFKGYLCGQERCIVWRNRPLSRQRLTKVSCEDTFWILNTNTVEMVKSFKRLRTAGIPASHILFGPTRHSFEDLYERRDEILAHREELNCVWHRLEDDKSKRTLEKVLARMMSRYAPHYEFEAPDFDQYFPNEFQIGTRDEVFVDGGMRDGANTLDFIGRNVGRRTTIVGFEPDPAGAELCRRNTAHLKDVTVIERALYFQTCDVRFLSSKYAKSPGSAHLDENGDVVVGCVEGDRYVPNPSVIKMDIEGFELHALKGFREAIMKCTPRLAICLYHRLSDLWEVPFYIWSMNPKYRLMIRNHECMRDLLETVCYAW